MTFKAMVAWIAVIAGIAALGISQARVSAQSTQRHTAAQPQATSSPMTGAQALVPGAQAQVALVDVKPIVPETAAKVQAQLASGDGGREAQMRRTPAPIMSREIGSEEVTIRHESITVNKSRTIRSDFVFADVLVGNSEVAEVVPLSDKTLYLLGKKLGTTNVSLVDANKRLLGLIDVAVEPDYEYDQAQIRRQERGLQALLVETGAGRLRVRRDGANLVLVGTAPDAVTVDRAVSALREGAGPDARIVNLTRVASPQQVLLKVRFVEVNRTAGRDFGVRWEYANRSLGVRAGTAGTGEPAFAGTAGHCHNPHRSAAWARGRPDHRCRAVDRRSGAQWGRSHWGPR